MDDALVVDGLEAFGDLGADSTDSQRWQRTAGDGLGERLSFEKLHDQIGMTLDHAKVGQVDDVGVVDHRRGLGFLDEALPGRLLLGFAQDLDGDGLAEGDVTSAIDDAHAAFAEPTLDGVAVVDGGTDELVLGQRRRISQRADMDRAVLVARAAASTSRGVGAIWTYRAHCRPCVPSVAHGVTASGDTPQLSTASPARSASRVLAAVDG